MTDKKELFTRLKLDFAKKYTDANVQSAIDEFRKSWQTQKSSGLTTEAKYNDAMAFLMQHRTIPPGDQAQEKETTKAEGNQGSLA